MQRPLSDAVKTVGRYAIESVLGAGAMGTVYRATDTTLRRPVALKVLEEGRSLPPREAIARFLREGRAAAALDHPNVVTVYDVGEDEGRLYLAMELVEGKTLRERMSEGAPSFATRVRWLVEVARALSAAHAVPIVHRDVKPENVLIDAKGTAKLTDFGIAKLRDRSPGDAGPVSFRTKTGALMGTPDYMAPEQWKTSDVDARADQYAWGVMAAELLDAAAPDVVQACIAKASAREAGDRHPSMDAIIAVLEPFTTKLDDDVVTAEEIVVPVLPVATRPPPKRSTPVFLIALGVTVVVGVAGVLVFRDRQRATTAEMSIDASPAPPSSAAPLPSVVADVADAKVDENEPDSAPSVTPSSASTSVVRPPLSITGEPRVTIGVNNITCLEATTPKATQFEADKATKQTFQSHKILPCFQPRIDQRDMKMGEPVRVRFVVTAEGITGEDRSKTQKRIVSCLLGVARANHAVLRQPCRGPMEIDATFTLMCDCNKLDIPHFACEAIICR